MNSEHMEGADFSVTVDGTCWLRCEVINSQIEYWFGDVGSGLHLFLDRPGFVKWTQVQSEVVERLQAVPEGAPISFVVGDDDIEIHGAQTGGWVRPQ